LRKEQEEMAIDGKREKQDRDLEEQKKEEKV
jgi:hypothetical protein